MVTTQLGDYRGVRPILDWLDKDWLDKDWLDKDWLAKDWLNDVIRRCLGSHRFIGGLAFHALRHSPFSCSGLGNAGCRDVDL
jgi:hypothetical protein